MVEMLNNARDGVRLAREQSEVTASSMHEFGEKIAVCSSRSNPDHLHYAPLRCALPFVSGSDGDLWRWIELPERAP